MSVAARRGGWAASPAAAAAPCWRRPRSPGSRSSPGCCSRPATATTPRPPTTRSPLGAAAVERRDLVDRQDVDGTLGFSDTTKATAPAAGTITRLRDEGDTVTRGRSLMSIDAKATAWVLYGTIPMYRDLGPGVSDGRDVRQLERNLKALGYDPGTVDDHWTRPRPPRWSTSRTIATSRRTRRSRARRSSSATGLRASASTAPRSAAPARAGAPVTELTSTTPVVTAKLDAGLAADVHSGDRGPRHPGRRQRGRWQGDQRRHRRHRRPERRVAHGRSARRPEPRPPRPPRRGAGERVARDRAHEGRARGARHGTASRRRPGATRSSSPGRGGWSA